MTEKRCPRCGETKPVSEWHRNKAASSGYSVYCKACMSIIRAAHYRENATFRERKRKQSARHYLDNKDRHLEQGWVRRLKRDFGITADEYWRMFEEQGGVCAICEEPETSMIPQTGTVRKLAVDHCHDCGRVRALLCARCNHVLGGAQDSTEYLEQVIAYLRRF